MARVDSSDVKKIIDVDITDLDPFIKIANILTDGLLNKGLSAYHLIEIERWLSAHFTAISNPRIKSESIGDASQTYDLAVLGEGLKSTTYGITAIAMDTSGTLAKSGKKFSITAIDCIGI